MRKKQIATIVNFCTNEARFLQSCLKEAEQFSTQVIVSVCDHFFDGTPENRELLERIYRSFPRCTFLEYPYIQGAISSVHCWHSFSRLLGVQAVDPSIEFVLFLDADEVVDGNAFKNWIETAEINPVQKLANYWYFRDPTNQATVFEDSPVLIQKQLLTPSLLFHKDERDALYNLSKGPKKRRVVDCEGNPMIHHYSWVRTEEEMLKKIKSWGHHQDKDWASLVKKEFRAPFQGKDFVHGYRYRTVASRLSDALFTEEIEAPTVIRLTKADVRSGIKKGKGSFWNLIFSLFR